MSNYLDITIYDFDSICRTCLCREDLKPFYEKSSRSTCLAEMLMSCTFLKFAEDDNLPVKICTNCIHQINQAFSFVKRCETTDTILRKCINKCKTELANNSSESQTLKAEEIIKIKPEIILSNIHGTERDVLEDYKFVEEIKQEVDVKIEYIEVKQEVVQIENEYDENYDNPAEENYKDIDENQDKTYSEKSDNSTKSQIEEAISEDANPLAKRFDLLKARQRIVTEKEKGKIKTCSNSALKEKPFTCTVCSKTFTRNFSLTNHMRIHTGTKPYSCDVCDKSFSSRQNLTIHKRIHTGEKPNVCSVCNKAFARSGQLNSHMRIHTGMKPYSCEICAKSFSVRHSLIIHKRIHTGEKPNVCSICSKAFTYLSNLKVHMRIHTGVKPYSCDSCNKSFSSRKRLTIHKGIHTGEKPNVCSVCSKAFRQRSSLKNHMRVHTVEKFVSKVSPRKGI